jgi:hypothetical protein
MMLRFMCMRINHLDHHNWHQAACMLITRAYLIVPPLFLANGTCSIRSAVCYMTGGIFHFYNFPLRTRFSLVEAYLHGRESDRHIPNSSIPILRFRDQHRHGQSDLQFRRIWRHRSSNRRPALNRCSRSPREHPQQPLREARQSSSRPDQGTSA